jgi:AraC-like DNA-binding protein
MECGRIRDTRHLAVPELGAFHTQIDLRSTALRLTFAEGQNVTSDFALLEKVAPFAAQLAPRPRAELLLVLRGQGRFEEGPRRLFMNAGEAGFSKLVSSCSAAYSGDVSRVLCVQWEPRVGVALPGGLTVVRFGARDLARLDEAAASLGGEHAAGAVRQIFGVLQSLGFAFEPSAVADLEGSDDPRNEGARVAWNGRLSCLHESPTIEEVASEVGWSTRHVNRRMGSIARHYALPWSHWKDTLHGVRMLQALRLLSSPGATTELVARATGFRSPNGLCHALAKGGLPSPGVLARAARRDVLDAWTAFAG